MELGSGVVSWLSGSNPGHSFLKTFWCGLLSGFTAALAGISEVTVSQQEPRGTKWDKMTSAAAWSYSKLTVTLLLVRV